MVRRRGTDDFAAEIESHLQFEVDRLQDEGLSADEARAAARRMFGNVTLATERFHESTRWPWWDSLLQDVRYGLRTWRRSPGFALVIVLTIALGVGATTAMFSVVDATLLHPLPYPNPQQLVSVVDDLPGAGSYDVGLSQPEWLDLQSSGVFENVAPAWFDENNLTGPSRPAHVRLMSVTPNYFAVLGVAPQLGRTFPADNRAPGFLLEVVISDGLWKRDFGGDPHVLDRSIRLDTDLYRIVGVMPPGFHAPGRSIDERNVDVWAATNFYGPPLSYHPARRVRNIPGAIGRLAAGMSLTTAQRRLATIVEDLRRRFPDDYPERSAWTIRLVPLHDAIVGDVRPPLVLMLCAVALVLAIGCVNIANLLLARGSARRREFAIRQSIGAGTGRLLRQLLTESMTLALLGGACGVIVLFVVKAWLERLVPEGLPRLNDISLNGSVLLFALTASVMSGIVFGFAPAVDAVRDRAIARRRTRTRSLLIIAEFALSLVLMVAAGLLLRSFRDLVNVGLGFTPEAVMTVRTRLPYPNDTRIDKYPTIAQEAPFIRELARRAGLLAGVDGVAVGSSSAIPLDHAHRDMNVMPLLVEGRGVDPTQAPIVDGSVVTPEYFRLLGMTLLRGRTFTDADTEATPAVAVINEAMARTFWPQADPIGAHVKLSTSAKSWTTIVGIVADARTEALTDAGAPQVFASAYQKTAKHLAIFLRGPCDTAATADRVREIVQSLDDTLPVFGAQPLTETVSGSLAARRFSMEVVALFALTALLLAAIGIYGVMSYTVVARTHEMGVRIALGAPSRHVWATIVAHGLKLSLIGAFVGLPVAVAVGHAMKSVLFGVQPLDPATFSVVAIALVAIATAACSIPARRAVRIDPLLALRCE